MVTNDLVALKVFICIKKHCSINYFWLEGGKCAKFEVSLNQQYSNVLGPSVMSFPISNAVLDLHILIIFF